MCVVQRSREQEDSLREQCNILQQDEEELRTAVLLLGQDNQTLREQLEHFKSTFHAYQFKHLDWIFLESYNFTTYLQSVLMNTMKFNEQVYYPGNYPLRKQSWLLE